MLFRSYLSQDPYSRLAIETFATTNNVIIGGEIRAPNISKHKIEDKIRQIVKEIGYEQKGFHWQNLKITNLIHEQSKDIAIGVDASVNKEEGAGDQGIMFGYACNETDKLMPAPIYYSHLILRNIRNAVKNNLLPTLGPDAKSQVTLIYENGKPIKAKTILVSIQHKPDITQKEIKDLIKIGRAHV